MRKMVLIFIIGFTLILVACGETKIEEPTSVLQSIEVTTQPNKLTYVEGESFDSTGIKVIANYTVGDDTETKDVTSDVTYDKTTLSLTDTSVMISYSEGNITKTTTLSITVNPNGELIGDGLTLDEPTSDMMILTSSTRGEATSYWYTAYLETGFYIKAIVKDSSIDTGSNTFNADGIEVLVSKVERVHGLLDGTLQINASVRDDLIVKSSTNNTFSDIEDSGITKTFEKVSFGGTYVEGYQIELTIPYTLLGTTQSEKDLTFVPSLLNNQGTLVIVATTDAFDIDFSESRTFVHVTDDNTYAENPWIQLGAVFGSYGALTHTTNWDLLTDDGTEDAFIQMNGNADGTDNNIYMHQSVEKELYAYASFNAKTVYNEEKWGKFGLIVSTLDGRNGFFLFIDASGDGTSMTGKNVAVVSRSNNEFQWPEKNLATLADANLYQGDNFIELAIYRDGNIFEFYLNGESIGVQSGFPGLTNDSDAIVGIASFNIGLIVKDYGLMLEDEDLEPFRFDTEDIDYLFIGDSYVDTAFWQGFSTDFNEGAINLGVGGTKVDYWKEQVPTLQSLYTPNHIIIHIGVNDINDGDLDGAVVLNNLKSLFNLLKLAYPDAQIHFVSIEPNNFKVGNFTKYQVVNEGVNTLSQTDTQINFIDTVTPLGGVPGAPVRQYFLPDGLHLNADGYGLWVKAIKTALGIEVIESQYNLGNDGLYARSYGWDFNEEYVENTGGNEQQIYFVGAAGTHFGVTVDINLQSIYNSDAFPKVGLALKSEDKTLFFFLDVNAALNNTWGNYVERPSGGDWQWATGPETRQYVLHGFDPYHGDNYKTLSLVRLGNVVYLLADGKVVQYVEDAFTEDEYTQASVLAFNLQTRLKNADIFLDTELDDYLDAHQLHEKTGPTIDGNLSDWDESILLNKTSIPGTDGRYVNIYAYMALEGLYIAYEAIHNQPVKTNDNAWFNNTNVEFRLGAEGNQRFASANGHYSRWEDNGQRAVGYADYQTTQSEGKYQTIFEVFIPWSMIDGYDYDSAFIPAGFAWKNPGEDRTVWAKGDFWYVPEADPGLRTKQITKTGFIAPSEHQIDGTLDDWSQSLKDNSVKLEKDDNNFELQAYLADDGIYGYFVADLSYQLNLASQSLDWWTNPNIEFWINNHHIRSMIFDEKLESTGFMTRSAYTYDSDENILIIEFFIHYHAIGLSEKPATMEFTFGSPLYGFWIIEGPNRFIDSNGILTP